MNLKRRSASRGELTGAMGATIQTVRKHEQQLAALIAGMQQLMDGQAALGEELVALRQRVQDIEQFPSKGVALEERIAKLEETDEDMLKRHTFASSGL